MEPRFITAGDAEWEPAWMQLRQELERRGQPTDFGGWQYMGTYPTADGATHQFRLRCGHPNNQTAHNLWINLPDLSIVAPKGWKSVEA